MAQWYVVFDSYIANEVKPIKHGVFQTKIDLLFYNEDQAIRHQQKLAQEKPGHLIVMCKGTTVIEAGVAPLIHKKFNEDGEIVPQWNSIQPWE